jgi:hypothetical protein
MALAAYHVADPVHAHTGEYKLDTATSAGTILMEDTTAGDVVAAEQAAPFVLETDVTATGVSLEDFLLGKASNVTKAESYCNLIRLRPGDLIETDQFAADADTGAIASDTALMTDLAVVGGKLRIAQAEVAEPPTPADTVLAELVENKITAAGTVVVRFKSIG